MDFAEAENLNENRLGIKVLYLPSYELLSESEKRSVEEFAKQGNKVYYYADTLQYGDITEEYFIHNPLHYNMGDTLKISGICPVIPCENPDIMVQVLEGEDYYLATVNNISLAQNMFKNTKLDVSRLGVEKAIWYTPGEEVSLETHNGTVIIPTISEGGFLLLIKGE